MGMDAHRKLEFVHAMTKLGLKHFDSGGVLPGLSNDLTVTNGYQASTPTSSNTIGTQQATLAGQLGTEAAGGGPNPAQSQYLQNAQNISGAQATNYAQNRALNPGLAARMAGNTAASTGQAAAAQAGTQQAQQQLAAQNEMLGLTGQEQNGLLGSQAINAQVAQNNANSENQTQGGILSGIGSAIVPGSTQATGGSLAKGGVVQKMATGGSINVPGAPEFSNANLMSSDHKQANQAGSSAGKWLKGMGSSSVSDTSVSGPVLGGGAGDAGGVSALDAGTMMAAKGGKVKKMDNGGGVETLAELAPLVALLAKGGNVKMDPNILIQTPGPASLMTKGGKVNAQNKKEKAVVKDDSQKNDKIPTLLSEGEIVLPRHVTQHPMAPQKAAEFVQAVLAKRKATGARAAA